MKGYAKAIFIGASKPMSYQNGQLYTVHTVRGSILPIRIESKELPTTGIEYRDNKALLSDWEAAK